MGGSDLDRMWAYEDLINARLAADKTPDFNHGWSRAIDYVLANPDVVLRALGGDAIVDWLETQDGYGFVVEALKNGSH